MSLCLMLSSVAWGCAAGVQCTSYRGWHTFELVLSFRALARPLWYKYKLRRPSHLDAAGAAAGQQGDGACANALGVVQALLLHLPIHRVHVRA
jgi:hypothetical protein